MIWKLILAAAIRVLAEVIVDELEDRKPGTPRL